VEKYDFLALKAQQGTSSIHREMGRPSKQFAWGEEKLAITSGSHLEYLLPLYSIFGSSQCAPQLNPFH
jgi:hypothetical protein